MRTLFHCSPTSRAPVSKTVTTHEWDTPYLVCREWYWCAITTCADFSNVSFSNNRFEDEINEIELVQEILLK